MVVRVAASPLKRLLATGLWLASVAGPGRGPAAASALAAAVLGVQPGKGESYAGSTFRCHDGSGGDMPASAINDESCDCADGSDEPGTGACAGQDTTLFFCANQGSVPKQLYASRVGDGVCDCCDGTDEASLSQRRPAAKCADSCAQEGAQKTAERTEKVAMLRRALQKQDEIRQEGLGTRDKLVGEMDTLKGELPELEKHLEATKKLADVEREVEAARKAAEDAAKQAAEAEEAARKAALVDPNCMWRQTGACDPAGAREANNDKACTEGIPKGNSGYCDCNGDAMLSDGEQGYTCEIPSGESSTEMRYCNEVCAKKEEVKEETVGEAATEEETPEEVKKEVHSEYSKWMDDGATAERKAAGEGEDEEKKPEVSEYSKWMDDGATAERKAAGEGEAEAPAAEAAAEEVEKPEAVKEETAIEKETAAQSKVTEHKDKIQELEESLTNLAAEKLGYASLHDKKLEKKVGEFDYSVDFFKSSSQDHTSLGTWSKWTGDHSAVFEEGTMCWGGPARKLNVNFVCGETEDILDVFEPSRCVYQATIMHPGACEHAELDMLAQGKQILHPKDEL